MSRFSWGVRIAIVVAIAAALLTAARAREAVLAPLQQAKPQRARLAANVPQRYSLALGQRECALGRLEPWAGAGQGTKGAAGPQLRVIDPATNKPLRKLDSGEFGFCVESAGTYVLEVRAAAGGGFVLTLDATLARKAGLPSTAPAPRPMSPRLRALDPQQLDAFWAEVKRSGTPLIEPDDVDNSWVTFLYRDSAARAVAVSWQMWTFDLENTALARLPGTDLWWKSVRFPNRARFSYQLVIDPPVASEELRERARDAVSQVDPNNRFHMTQDPKVDGYQQRSIVQLPAADPERWLAAVPTIRGRVESRTLASKQLGHSHALSVYLPPGYEHGRHPLLIFFDGGTYLKDIPTPRLLDALIGAHAIEPLVALFVHDDEPSSRAEELPCNPQFAAFVAEELLPFARAQLRVSDDIGLAGSSFGGLASSYIAMQYPDRFSKVLSQSGSYWWSFPAKHPQFDGSDKPGWLRRRLVDKPKVGAEFYLSAGTFERAPDAWGVLEQNQLQRDALRAKGYSVAYQEFVGGHDHLAWRATLPDALIALYPP